MLRLVLRVRGKANEVNEYESLVGFGRGSHRTTTSRPSAEWSLRDTVFSHEYLHWLRGFCVSRSLYGFVALLDMEFVALWNGFVALSPLVVGTFWFIFSEDVIVC